MHAECRMHAESCRNNKICYSTIYSWHRKWFHESLSCLSFQSYSVTSTILKNHQVQINRRIYQMKFAEAIHLQSAYRTGNCDFIRNLIILLAQRKCLDWSSTCAARPANSRGTIYDWFRGASWDEKRTRIKRNKLFHWIFNSCQKQIRYSVVTPAVCRRSGRGRSVAATRNMYFPKVRL